MNRSLLSISTRVTLIALVAGTLALIGAPAASAATVVSVAPGYDHTCAVTTGGGLRCWGGNGSGQLGNGSTVASATPVNVSGLSSEVAAVSVGVQYSCALTTAGGVRCWGAGTSGQLGDGQQASSSTPVTPTGLGSGVRSVSAGYAHACALLDDGTVRCWGANGQGPLG